MNFPRLLITLGIILLAMGLLWPWLHPLLHSVLQKTGLGRLPGDIVIEREHARFYFPLTTSLIISILLSLLFWLLRK